MLHHIPSENTVFRTDILYCPYKNRPSIARNREKSGGFPSDFRDFLNFGHNCPAVAFDELLNAAAEGDGSSDVVAQCREREFGGDLFLAPAEKMATVGVILPSTVSRILDRRGALIVKCRRSIL